jgi:hypothetical protein
MKIYTLNDYVYFKMTNTGHRIEQRKAKEFHKENPEIDIRYSLEPYKGDWYRTQMHDLFRHFGDRTYVGQLLPIKDLTFEEPD